MTLPKLWNHFQRMPKSSLLFICQQISFTWYHQHIFSINFCNCLMFKKYTPPMCLSFEISIKNAEREHYKKNNYQADNDLTSYPPAVYFFVAKFSCNPLREGKKYIQQILQGLQLHAEPSNPVPSNPNTLTQNEIVWIYYRSICANGLIKDYYKNNRHLQLIQLVTEHFMYIYKIYICYTVSYSIFYVHSFTGF